jgi:transposase
MSNRRFEMYHYRQLLARMRQGDSDRDIARSKLMGRRKIAHVRQIAEEHGWLDPAVPLPDDAGLAEVFGRERNLPPRCVSTLEPWREQIARWHAAGIGGTAIHAALRRNHGYAGSYSSMQRFLSHLVNECEPDVPLRLEFAPGEASQIDFGAGPVITDVHTGEVVKTWFFVMTLCYSRHQYAEFVLDQTVDTWLACHRRAFEWFGGVPARLIIDNAKCAITRACAHEPEVQRAYAQAAEGYGFKIDPCPPRDPQKKGIVESGVKYIKGSFVPLREFRSLSDANRQLHEWVMGEAGSRIHGTTKEQPLKRFAGVEKPLLSPLPDVPPELATWAKVKVHRDAHVQYEHNLYSVPFRLAGCTLWLKATSAMVTLYRDHEAVAAHVRATGRGMRRTVADHLPEAAAAWKLRDAQWCLKEAERIGPACHALVHALFSDAVLERLRAVQGILRLAHKHGDVRLEAACSRANHYGTQTYRAVKTILDKGMEQQPMVAGFDALAATYTEGGRFCRDTSTMLQ